jgi:hypothetical protein
MVKWRWTSTWSQLQAAGGARQIVIFSKRDCHLCEAVENEIRSMTIVGSRLAVVSIDEDSVLHEKYWLRVPVVRLGSEDVFEAKMMDPAGEWRKRLRRLLEPIS